LAGPLSRRHLAGFGPVSDEGESRPAAEAVSSGLAGVAAAAVGGTSGVGELAAVMAIYLTEPVLRRVTQATSDQAVTSARKALAWLGVQQGEPAKVAERLDRLMSNEQGTILLRRALVAAQDTANEEKLRLLGAGRWTVLVPATTTADAA